MAKPKAMVLFAPGTNCDEETAYCLNRSGADARRVLVSDLLDGDADLTDYQMLVIPGGFSYGDCIAAGRILANTMNTFLAESVRSFLQQDRLVIGICNGFQVLVRQGLFSNGVGNITLEQNESAKFECRWVHLAVDSHHASPFLTGIDRLYLPVAHAEGRLVTSAATLDTLVAKGQIALRYARDDNERDVAYPDNPNGSMGNIAGLTDLSGRVFGLMPHPERYFDRDCFFSRRRSRLTDEGESLTGLKIFENAVAYFR